MAKRPLSTFDKCKKIKNLLLTQIGDALSYESWSRELVSDSFKSMPDYFVKWKKNHKDFKIDPTDLTLNEMDELGFGRHPKKRGMRLIPIWLFPFLADEFECEDLSGKKYSELYKMDNEHTSGFLPYGVTTK